VKIASSAGVCERTAAFLWFCSSAFNSANDVYFCKELFTYDIFAGSILFLEYLILE